MEQTSPGKVVVSVNIEGQVIVGRRDELRRLKLLGKESPGEVTSFGYFRDAWIMVYENSDQLDPALVYAVSKDSIIPVMELLEKRFKENLVTLEAGIRGVKSLLGVPVIDQQGKGRTAKRPTQVTPPLPTEMFMGVFQGVTLCGAEADLQRLGIPTTPYESSVDLITDFYLVVSLMGEPALLFWAWDRDSLVKVGAELSVLGSVFGVGIIENNTAHEIWHHGALVPPPN